MASKKTKKVKKKGPRKPWFRKINEKNLKKGSWGFVPINWKGTLALALLIIINVFAGLYFNLNVLDGKMWAKFGVVFLLSLLVFILLAKNKTRGIKDDI